MGNRRVRQREAACWYRRSRRGEAAEPVRRVGATVGQRRGAASTSGWEGWCAHRSESVVARYSCCTCLTTGSGESQSGEIYPFGQQPELLSMQLVSYCSHQLSGLEASIKDSRDRVSLQKGNSLSRSTFLLSCSTCLHSKWSWARCRKVQQRYRTACSRSLVAQEISVGLLLLLLLKT